MAVEFVAAAVPVELAYTRRAMRSRALLAIATSLLAAGIAGCGSASDNGVASKPPDQIVSAAMNAVSGVKSVHVTGSLVSGGTPIKLNLTLVTGKGGSGQMSLSGASFEIIALNQTVYINGTDAFWRRVGGNAAAQLFHGRWLRAPANGPLASVGSLTDVQTLFNKLLSTHGTLANGGTTTVAGQKVVAVNDTTRGGTLYVATTGKAYPVQISKTGSQGGRVVFDRYNEPVSLSAPANSTDVSKLPSS